MKLNKKLLKILYLINRPSGYEKDMINFIINYCYKIPKVHIELDDYDNLFITRNTTNPTSYPCIVAHLDAVFNFFEPREIVEYNNILSARYIRTKECCGLTADDGNGILIALQLLETFPDLKVCFTVEEEIGANGASHACKNTAFFNDVRYLIQPDRRGSSDLIVHTNCADCCSDEFLYDVYETMQQFGYDINSGTFTDIGVLSQELGISAVNVSCGYKNEHTSLEYCDCNDLENCLNFIYTIITVLPKDKFYKIPIVKSYTNTTFYNKDVREYHGPLEDSFDDPCKGCTTFDCMRCTRYGSYY